MAIKALFKHHGYRLKGHNPYRRALGWLLMLALFIGSAIGMFKYGQYYVNYAYYKNSQQLIQLNQELQNAQQRINELLQTNEELNSQAAIKTSVAEHIRQQVHTLNQQIAGLKKEVNFYRSLLSPSDLEPGLQILGVYLSQQQGATDLDSKFQYKIVLTQGRNGQKYISGNVKLLVSGIQDGEERDLAIEDIGTSDAAIAFHFKSLQNLEGELVLPSNFMPRKLSIQAIPSTRDAIIVQQDYAWNDIIN